MWTKIHPYEDLPRDARSTGGVGAEHQQSSVGVTRHCRVLDPAKFPAYISPVVMSFRAEQRGLLLMSKPKLSFQDFMGLKMSTQSQMAVRVLDPLLAAGGGERSSAGGAGGGVAEGVESTV